MVIPRNMIVAAQTRHSRCLRESQIPGQESETRRLSGGFRESLLAGGLLLETRASPGLPRAGCAQLGGDGRRRPGPGTTSRRRDARRASPSTSEPGRDKASYSGAYGSSNSAFGLPPVGAVRLAHSVPTSASTFEYCHHRSVASRETTDLLPESHSYSETSLIYQMRYSDDGIVTGAEVARQSDVATACQDEMRHFGRQGEDLSELPHAHRRYLANTDGAIPEEVGETTDDGPFNGERVPPGPLSRPAARHFAGVTLGHSWSPPPRSHSTSSAAARTRGHDAATSARRTGRPRRCSPYSRSPVWPCRSFCRLASRRRIGSTHRGWSTPTC